MYAIANIIYGIPLISNEIPSIELSDELKEIIEDDDTDGILSFYSGSGDNTPAAFGILLGQFDEACAYTDISKLKLTPIKEDIDQFEMLFNNLSNSLKIEIASISKPFVFFLWSNS